MDRISEQFVSQFVAESDLGDLDPSVQFEHFAAHITVSKHLRTIFNTEDIVTGGGGDTSIDGIAVLVNGSLVTDLDALNDIDDSSGELSVTFVFIQATTSSSFDGKHMNSFGNGVRDFFSESPTLKRNANVAASADLVAAVLSKSIKFTGNPSCILYYVSTGRWENDSDLVAHIERIRADVIAKQLFARVEFFPVDGAEAQKLYRKTKTAIRREFKFNNRIVLPEVDGVIQSYIGVLPASEFLKLLYDDETQGIIGSLFYDNVRDWHGYDVDVNEQIRTTLTTTGDRFALMNNGVTIIARKLSPLADKFLIEDYSIVNGCQTSNVLFDQRLALDPRVTVPIRLIHTDNPNIIKDIIHSTNFQTAIKPEQFYALEDFSKELEDFFCTFADAKRLYYERRDCQYKQLAIKKGRIVTKANMIKAFAAMFLNEPHRTTRNFSGLKAKVGEEIFVKNHKCDPYYTAAFALYKLERILNSRPELKPARFHMLMVTRMLGNSSPLPRFNANEMVSYCAVLNQKLWSTPLSDSLFAEVTDVMEQATGGVYDRDKIRTEPFTATVVALCSEKLRLREGQS